MVLTGRPDSLPPHLRAVHRSCLWFRFSQSQTNAATGEESMITYLLYLIHSLTNPLTYLLYLLT